MRLSNKIAGIEESYLNKWDSYVKGRIDAGEDILQFNLGQPDFACPEFVKRAIEEAAFIDKNNFYNHTGGTDGARLAIAKMENDALGMQYGKDEIIVTNGAKEAIFLALSALLDPGDEVIVVAPYWPTYVEAVKFLGGNPIVLDADLGFHLDVGAIGSVVNERTKAIIINSPNNPTGVVYDEQELAAIARIAIENDLVVISDEVYGMTVFDGKKHLSIARLPDMKARTVIIDSFSKMLSMAGYRLGFAAASEEMIAAMIKAKSNINGNTNTLVQMTAEVVMNSYGEELDQFVETARQEYRRRRDFTCEKLKEAGVERLVPAGSFYVFAQIPPRLEKDSLDFAEYLLNTAKVAVAPGTFFGGDYDNYFRLSFSASMEDLEEGLERLKKSV